MSALSSAGAGVAERSGMPDRIEAMFAGERINVSENRSALHVALRMPQGASVIADGVDVVKQVHVVLDRRSAFSERVRPGNGEATRASRSADDQIST